MTRRATPLRSRRQPSMPSRSHAEAEMAREASAVQPRRRCSSELVCSFAEMVSRFAWTVFVTATKPTHMQAFQAMVTHSLCQKRHKSEITSHSVLLSWLASQPSDELLHFLSFGR